MRVLAIVKRIFQEMFRDKRTLALLFVAPLLILSLMYLLFNSDTTYPRLGIVNIDERWTAVLEATDIIIVPYDEADETTIIEDDLDGVLTFENGKPSLIVENSEPTIAKQLTAKVTQAALAFALSNAFHVDPSMLENSSGITTTYIYGDENTVFFDTLMPILVGFFVFFFVFLISGIGLLKERTTGTLERLLTTPIRRWEIVTAYLTGFGLFAIIQTLIVVFYSITVLDVVLVGSFWNVVLINLLVALVALSLGILLSTFAASEFQMVQFIPLVVVPQVFFTGIIPMDGMADWLQAIGKVMPMYYAADALKGVMYRGVGLMDVRWDLVALLVFATVFIVLNIFALKKYRKL